MAYENIDIDFSVTYLDKRKESYFWKEYFDYVKFLDFDMKTFVDFIIDLVDSGVLSCAEIKIRINKIEED